MTETVQRLRDELALAEELERLETAREAMHADRSAKNVKVYKQACTKVVAKRQAFREKYPPPPPAPGDAQARPETIAVKIGGKVGGD